MRNVLIIDYAGRGHAFADLFVRTDPDVTVHLAPGCAAITDDRIVSAPWLDIYHSGPVVEYAREIGADLAMPAHPRSLTEGFVDELRAAGIPTIGPDRSATRLESSKKFTKELCVKYGIPTAGYRYFEDPAAAIAYVRSVDGPHVVKGNESCQGNGVFICDTEAEAIDAINRLMVSRDFGPGGRTIIIEEKLVGRELLYFALVGGEHHLMLPMAVDYPRSDDGNRGVMCGGMGAFSPSPDDTPEEIERFERQMLRPLLAAINAEGLHYTGVIYVGCMLVGDQLHLIEINARMGDPEAEVVFPRITTNFTEVAASILDGSLDRQPPLAVTDECFVNVVATQGPTREPGRSFPGWPYGEYGRGYPITGLDAVDRDRCLVFYGAARTRPDGQLVTDGGKSINLVGRGATLDEAASHAYQAIAEVSFQGIRYRNDIAKAMPWD
ncbi:phosphoribosylamine--glycine ligase [Micromonospora sp. NPDC048169]|uniref:phosphoribosylamine--glycine ligase n=1 Tax=unclassified Micromonospora TaxID=2617518 RepID=UPI003400A643